MGFLTSSIKTAARTIMVVTTITMSLHAQTILVISPPSIAQGSQGFTLSVLGGPFSASAVVLWNGEGRTTTFFSSSLLKAAIPAADVAGVGSALVTVTDNGTSNSVPFTVYRPLNLA